MSWTLMYRWMYNITNFCTIYNGICICIFALDRVWASVTDYVTVFITTQHLLARSSSCFLAKQSMTADDNTVSQKTPTQSFRDNFDERGPNLIILSLLHSEMNYRKSRNKICHLTLNRLPHYLAKLKCVTVQLFIHISHRIIYTSDDNFVSAV